MNKNIKILAATEDNMDFIYASLKHMAEEEGMGDRFCHNKDELKNMIFDQKHAEIEIAYVDSIPAALAMFSVIHYHFDLFKKPGLYIHDLYVAPNFRRHGLATKLLDHLKIIAKERDLGRIDFVVIKNNDSGLKFYERYGNIREVDHIKQMTIRFDE